MQSGGGARNTPQPGRVAARPAAKPTRNADEKRRRVGDGRRWAQDVRAGSVGDVTERGKPPAPAVRTTRTKVIAYTKADENRVSDSIQKLLSVYQSAKADKAPDGPRAEPRRPRMYAGRNVPSRIPEMQACPRNSLSPDKSNRRRVCPLEKNGSHVRDPAVQKTEDAQVRKTVTIQEPKLSSGVSRTGLASAGAKSPEEGTKTCDEITLLLTPDRTAHSPLTQIRSFITNYLEEDPGHRPDSRNKLEFFVPETSANAFPVCSKMATDHIPSPDPVQAEASPRELIIMLRRRNSEPYSPKNCILQYSRREDDHPLSPAGSDSWGFENYYFWEQGPVRPSRPYWEVSLFKSSSALDSSALPSLTPAPSGVLVDGRFGLRAALQDRAARSWNPDLHACRSVVRTVPLASPIDSVTRVPAETPREGPRTRGVSKDDQYRHPAHLLVYVKSSQKRLVSLDPGRGGCTANRKVHKIRKIAGGAAGARTASSTRNVAFAILSALILVTGGLACLLYFLAGGPALFSLTPPIPGLLRRC